MYDDDDDPFPPPEPYEVPKDPKKLKARIRRYERSLEQEKRQRGAYGDGYGKRFLLGPFYMILGDLEGALKSFAWFEAAFPDSLDDAPQTLCWSLALYRAGKDKKAREMLWRTMFANLYVIPRLLGMEVTRHDIRHGSNLEEPSYLNWIPGEYWDLWSDEDRDWARDFWESEEFREARRRYIELGHALKSLKCGPERHGVIEEMRRLERAYR